MKSLIFSLFFFLLSSASPRADELQAGYSFKVENGSLETTSGETINTGEIIQVLDVKPGDWKISVQRLDEFLRPLGPILYVSKDWAGKTLGALELDEVVQMVQGLGDQVESPGRVEPCPELALVNRKAEIVRHVDEVLNPKAPEVLDKSLRPKRRPESFGAIESLFFKTPAKADQYFTCYQKDDDLMMDYHSKYKSSIRRMSRAYNNVTGGEIPEADMETLMSCLIFRESAHFKGGTSSTGAKGLGQFTQTARAQIRNIISYDPKDPVSYELREVEQRSERNAGRISDRVLRRNLSIIHAERRNNDRMIELQNLWESIPLSDRPSADEVNSSFTADNDNHEAIMAMSALMVRNCQIRLEHDGLQMDTRSSLLACAGAYNMGVGGFKDNALSRSGPQSLAIWADNLQNSGHPQARETRNHLISVSRCIERDKNFPPCGTDKDYCQALPMANPCLHEADLKCSGECR